MKNGVFPSNTRQSVR